jgi:hypothetical protein
MFLHLILFFKISLALDSFYFRNDKVKIISQPKQGQDFLNDS